MECITYRMSVHTTADDPKRYRTDEEVAEWEKRDPIVRFQNYLKDKGLLSDEKIQAVEEAVKSEVKAAEGRWEEITRKTPDPLDMFEHLYAEMPPHLLEQRAELERELAEKGKEADNG